MSKPETIEDVFTHINNQGGAAFPSSLGTATWTGMTLRDYFAAQAMQAIIGKLELCGVNPPTGTGATGHSEASKRDIMGCIARGAYEYADAMLEERAR